MAARDAGARVHVVLIPGFAGFDALGQLEYYAGVTPFFREWQCEGGGREALELHYFDNFPTAAVKTRARRLATYLARRIARGEMVPGEDAIVLVGHSTGGLDIRQLLGNLCECPGDEVTVDGDVDECCRITQEEIAAMIRRVVFLSVPHYGTNIADWVRTYALGRTLVVSELRAAVASTQVPLLDRAQVWIAGVASRITDADAIRAAQDALAEADASGSTDPVRVAAAHEAASQLELWLRHMAWDFAAINDLTAEVPSTGPSSPAHFNAAEREREAELWAARIPALSVVTRAPRLHDFTPGSPAPRWDIFKPWTWPDLRPIPGSTTDVLHRACWRACAGGPFRSPDPGPAPEPSALPGGAGPVETWDNDGIVNTASMTWPHAERALLVECDHMDVVGHYRLVAAAPDEYRTWHTYDLLRSGSPFGEEQFTRVWETVFEFCAAEVGAERAGAAGR